MGNEKAVTGPPASNTASKSVTSQAKETIPQSISFLVYGYEAPRNYNSYFPEDCELIFKSNQGHGGSFIILRDANTHAHVMTYALESLVAYDVISDAADDMDLLSLKIRDLGVFLFECHDGRVLFEKITHFWEAHGPIRPAQDEKDEDEDPAFVKGEKRIIMGFVKNLGIPLTIISAYLSLSFIFYGHVFDEEWGFVDSIYFGMVTMSTVGYGDLTPTTTQSKIFTMFFILFGIATVANALGNMAQWIIDKRAELQDRIAEKAKVGLKTTIHGKKVAVTRVAKEDSPGWIKCIANSRKIRSVLRMRKKDLTFYLKVIKAAIPTFVVLLAGAAAVMHLEGWHFVDCMYFGVITSTTVGYGDFSPSTPAGRCFVGFFIPIAAVVMFNGTSLIASHFIFYTSKGLNSFDDLHTLDKDGDGCVSVEEYQIHMLLKLGKVQGPLLRVMEQQFQSMDLNGDGSLSVSDISVKDTKAGPAAGKAPTTSPAQPDKRTSVEDVIEQSTAGRMILV